LSLDKLGLKHQNIIIITIGIHVNNCLVIWKQNNFSKLIEELKTHDFKLKSEGSCWLPELSYCGLWEKKIRQGLTLQQSLKHAGWGCQVHNLTEEHKQMNHWVHSYGHPFLKIVKWQEYLEAESRLSVSMKISNLIYSYLSISGPST
jgi:hypothetical protein